GFHEPVRQYAWDRLVESGKTAQIRSRHLDFFLAMANAAEPKLQGAEQARWLERLEIEHDNLRAAAKWSQGGGDRTAGLWLAGNLRTFWFMRGYYTEGREWLEGALAAG